MLHVIRFSRDILATCIDQRATGITTVDGGIRLDEAFYGIGTHRTCFRTDDTCRHRGSQVEGITHGQDPLSQLQVIGIADRQRREILALDFNQGQIGLLVRTDNAPLELAVVVQLHQQFVRLAHHVVVGHDITVGRNNHSRTRTFTLRGLYLPLLAASAPESEEIAEEVGERILYVHGLRLTVRRHLDVYHCVDGRLRSLGQIHQAGGGGRRLCLDRCLHASHHTKAAYEKGGCSQYLSCCLFHCFCCHIVHTK